MFSLKSRQQNIDESGYAKSWISGESIRAQERASIRSAQVSLAQSAMAAASRGGGGQAQPRLSRQELNIIDKENEMKGKIQMLGMQNRNLELNNANMKLQQSIQMQNNVLNKQNTMGPVPPVADLYNQEMQNFISGFGNQNNTQRR
jgi:hypothetical protein